MTDATSAARWRAGILAAVLIAGGSGYWLGQSGQSDAPSEAAGSGGRSTTEQYTPLPAGLAKLRPSRPRPAVCPPASTSVPWAVPSSASSFAVRLVLSRPRFCQQTRLRLAPTIYRRLV